MAVASEVDATHEAEDATIAAEGVTFVVGVISRGAATLPLLVGHGGDSIVSTSKSLMGMGAFGGRGWCWLGWPGWCCLGALILGELPSNEVSLSFLCGHDHPLVYYPSLSGLSQKLLIRLHRCIVRHTRDQKLLVHI